MITRIVKMVFKKEGKDEFITLFKEVEWTIKKYKGCQELILMEDQNEAYTLFTISEWDNNEDLENYRNSEFFKQTWSKTKQLLEEKTMVWTLDKIN